MKKIKLPSILLIVAILSSHLSFSQNDINQLDENGERHGVWKKYYSNDRIRYQGTFEHGKEVGTFKYYSAAQSDYPNVIKEYKNAGGIADVRFYNDNGLLLSSGKMDGKNRVGKWQFYHEDGKTMMSEENYVDGKLDGDYKTFYNTGKPTEVGYYKNGKLDSVYRKYSIKGHLYQHFHYKNGLLNGKAVYYNRKTGELTTKGEFKDDKKVGTWENYLDGELVSTEQPNKKKERPKKQVKN
ncbi:toxin-antitoxin system YwqK family antitoxin [Aureibaculum sp. 2210JD6-5]|uniref:toxin-antitoxin system YwqK family antitoxin n=1 Tax=Aureibaculum sp. 2210JD6-5 TaxID=3103957 RepID=UPI002AAD3CBE|nr:toxin-antitoxin system YwqK family antitoxin [Aureibaculum sp. 2210JD6-5]MDY7396102.1 toxin-antitoxin system YwqK family antitoxin [Aureibaculum sp. 2210JD6-5]